MVTMKRWDKLLVSCVGLAMLQLLLAESTTAQSRWSTGESTQGWTRPTPPANPSGPGHYHPGRPGGYPPYGHHHDHYPYDNVNLGIILSPDWIGGWNNAPNAASGGYYAPGGSPYDQPVLDRPPIYSGQPAPNFYQAPRLATPQTQYLTPHSGYNTPTPAPTLGQSPTEGSTSAPQTAVRRRSILVRPESDPTLSQTLCAGSPAESDYETSRVAFAEGNYQAATVAAQAAVAADPGNGKLQLYLAQCSFAVGEFEQSAEALTAAFQQLPPEQWGLVIENFRQFYKRNDYVPQFERLLSFSEQSEQRALGAALQAYHYRYLGHPDAAEDQLKLALQAETPPRLAAALRPLIQSSGTIDAESLPAPAAGN